MKKIKIEGGWFIFTFFLVVIVGMILVKVIFM
jgi:hypothetical protein